MSFKLNTQNLKVLTPSGYRWFRGIQKIQRESLHLTFDQTELKCSKNHPICVNLSNTEFVRAIDLDIGSKVIGVDGATHTLIGKEDIGVVELYDLIDVEGGYMYYTNGILSHNCVFLQHGDGAIDYEYFDTLVRSAKPAVEMYEDGCYRIFEPATLERIYVAGVDTAEGVGKDHSVITILDMTDLTNIEQVAVYSSNRISPYDFTTKVYEILCQWGKPLALIERNGVGAQVADNLRNRYSYEKIVNWGGQLANRKQQNGMISHSNTKGKAITNMRYWLNELKCVKLNDIETIKEFRDFTRYPNGSWAAKTGCHDDKVMSTVWALMALFDDICQLYFEIAETDDNNKPKKIIASDLGYNLIINSKSIYTDNEIFNNDIFTLPCVFGIGGQIDSDINTLEQDGWMIYG
jgi:hypothetical protein